MAGDFSQMEGHRLGVGLRHDEGDSDPSHWTDRPEDVGPIAAAGSPVWPGCRSNCLAADHTNRESQMIGIEGAFEKAQ